MTPDPDDPGWFSRRTWWWMFVPQLALRRAGGDRSTSALQLLRLLFSSFCMALVTFGIVLVFVIDGEVTPSGGPSPMVVALVVAGYGLLSLVLPSLVERPLDCSSDLALIGTYRTRFFLRIAFAEAAALIGFVGSFLINEVWPYPLGALFTFVGFVRLAPTSGNLEREDWGLSQLGCTRSLRVALVKPPPGVTG